MDFSFGRKMRDENLRLISFGTSGIQSATIAKKGNGPARFLTVGIKEYPSLRWGIRSGDSDLEESSKGASAVLVGIDTPFLVPRGLRLAQNRFRPQDPCSRAELRTTENEFSWQIREYVRHTVLPEYGEGFIAEVLVNEYTVDGFRVSNPLGFTGRELACILEVYFVPQKIADTFAATMSRPTVLFLSHMSALTELIRRYSTTPHFAVLDIGGLHTQLAVVRKGVLESVVSLAFGAGMFTAALVRAFALPIEEAERLKREYSAGTLSSFLEGKVRKVIGGQWPHFVSVCADALAPLKKDGLVRTVFLSGGGMLLPECDRLLLPPADLLPGGKVVVSPAGKACSLPARQGILTALANRVSFQPRRTPFAFRSLRRLPIKG